MLKKKHPLLWYFILTFAITWGLASLYFLFPTFFVRISGEMSVANPLFILAVWAPNIAGVVVVAVSEGKVAVVRLLKRFVPVHVSLVWYMLVLFLMPAAGVLINVITSTPIKFLTLPTGEFLSLLFVLLITGPLGEELGWRGFALPRLLHRHSASVSSLILGVIWAIWHFPSFFVPGLPQAEAQIVIFFLGAVSLSIIITWIMIHTTGSVFLSFLLHYTVNFTISVLGTRLIYVMLFQFVLAVILLAVFGWNLRRLPVANRK